uniref:Oncosphere protein Tso31c n=1 Tax=Taenia solium TaxID=6204 RepID=Q08EV6_TAESO|nr:oncosphere protein Tso31c [Taenia solium]ABH07375.1 oncosphere protein Tso31c [Taenia solium]
MRSVKMSFQLYLILLVTSVLAEKDKATTEPPIGQYFHWGEVDFQSVSLSWETEKLHSLLDAEITIKAVLTPGPGPERSTIAYLSDGEVTLDGLIPNSSYAVTAAVVRGKTTTSEPFSKGKATLDGLVSNSLYAVTVTGLVEGYKYFDFTENIKTLDTGHGKGGVARTGGFGITSVVVGLLFTCMALVLD